MTTKIHIAFKSFCCCLIVLLLLEECTSIKKHRKVYLKDILCLLSILQLNLTLFIRNIFKSISLQEERYFCNQSIIHLVFISFLLQLSLSQFAVVILLLYHTRNEPCVWVVLCSIILASFCGLLTSFCSITIN